MSSAVAAEELTGHIKELLTIDSKSRHDPACDQYSRIFMVRLLLVCTIVIGVNEHRDAITCIIPNSLDICNQDEEEGASCNFVNGACWVQGLYVYKQLIDKVNTGVAYYGIPKNIDQEGYMQGTGELCNLEPKLGVEPSEKCIPMEKTFFLHYQYMAFLVASIGLLYYLPYIMFCRVNRDMIALKIAIKAKKPVTLEDVLDGFFKRDYLTSRMSFIRPLLNVVVKASYVCVHFIAFLLLDNVLHGEFVEYGIKWLRWSQIENSIRYNYMGTRDTPKPGNRLLPPFGYCEFYESARDVKISKSNKIKLVCEISQHVLFQYCLLILWFAIAVGILVSLLGFVHQVATYLSYLGHTKNERLMRAGVSVREMEYIAYIKTRDANMHREILQTLTGEMSINGGNEFSS